MSTGGDIDITCACGHQFKAWLWQSANVTASPDLRTRILHGRMNLVKCPSCGHSFHVEVPFLYHDMKAREWIWVYPLDHEKESGRVRAQVDEMWEQLKSTLPPDVKETFEMEYKVIVLFGMDALVYYLQGKRIHDAKGASN